MFIALAILVAVVIYFMTPDERVRAARALMTHLQRLRITAGYGPDERALPDALRARARWPIVTPFLLAANIVVAVLMLARGRALDDPSALIAWGASFGPRTTNGEWWRLVTSLFVHSSLIGLFVDLVGIAQVGLLLERLVGRVAFAAAYLGCGVLARLVEVSAHSVAVSAGAPAAVFGAYGLLFASAVWGFVQRSEATVPLVALRRLAPGVALFLLYYTTGTRAGSVGAALGLTAGVAWGTVLARGASYRKPPARRVAIVTASMIVTIGLTAVCAAPLGGVTDVRPELARVVAIETRTAETYQTAVNQFTRGRLTAFGLIRVIDRDVLPPLRSARARLAALQRVPREHQARLAAAKDFLRLREQSWRLRAEALRRSSTNGLRQADSLERASLDAFERLRGASTTS